MQQAYIPNSLNIKQITADRKSRVGFPCNLSIFAR